MTEKVNTLITEEIDTVITDEDRVKALESVKMGTPAQVFWQDAETKLENSIMQYEESLIGDKAMLEIAKRRIAEEKEKLK